MIKKIVLLLVLFLIPTLVYGEFLGIKKSTGSIVMAVHLPLDGDGTPQWPDSVAVVTFGDNGGAAAYAAEDNSTPFSTIGMDTTNYEDDTLMYYLADIADIDGAGDMSTLSIRVTCWANDTSFTSNGVVQILDIADQTTVDSVYDSLIIATRDVENLDSWDPILDNDSLIVDQSSLEDMTVATATDVTNGVTVTTNSDKTGYSLSQTFPTNFSSMLIATTGGVIPTDTTETGDSIAVKSSDWTAADSVAYQGTASGITVAQIYAALMADTSLIYKIATKSRAFDGMYTVHYPVGSRYKDSVKYYLSDHTLLWMDSFVNTTDTTILDSAMSAEQ